MFIIHNFIDDVIKNTVGQIKYRESVKTGEITVDNGDGTYDVKIAQAGVAISNVPTAHYGDVFAVGEIAIITYEYGNKEMPRIWGHAKKIAQNPVNVVVDYSGGGGDPITTVTTLDAYLITETTAYLEGRIALSEGIGNCTRRGFKYGLTTNYGSDIHEDGDYGEGAFALQVSGLTAEETYHFQAYVLDADGDKQTGGDKTVTTSTITEIKNIYVVYKKNSDSKYYLVKINSDDSVTAIAELTELYGVKYSLVRILTDNSGNIYALRQTENGTNVYTWYKYNDSGVLQISKVMGANEMFGFIASDGYLYTMKSNLDYMVKRNLSDLESAGAIGITMGHRFYYLCFDSGGYLYTYDRDFSGGAAFVKWKDGVVASHIQGLPSISAWADWSLLGNNIACEYDAMWTINIALNSDKVSWTLNDIPSGQAVGSAVNQTYRYVIGENTADDKLIVEKYNSSKVLQSTIEISTDYISGGYCRFHNAITAYPY